MSKSASGAKKYYCEKYYKEGHSIQSDYYHEGNQQIGLWGGKGAETLGLYGVIRQRDFTKLCDNIDPKTGETLTARHDANRTVGYDFTFNASKSVSLAYAFGDDESKNIILDAFHNAVSETMREIERGMLTRVRAQGKDENRATGNIAYGEFTHFTTRPIDGIPDPHLHSHCFVFNATFDAQEDQWKAGQFRQIKQDAPFFEAFFHSTLADKLRESGFGITRTQKGFELKGIEKETLDKFSRRTKEIEEYAEEHSITSNAQKSQIGAKTRESKRETVDTELQLEHWQNKLTEKEKHVFQNLRSDHFGEARDDNAQAAVDLALNHHLERKSVASDKEIMASAIKASVGQATPAEVKESFAAKEGILRYTEDHRTFITTKEALAEEKQLIQRSIASRNKYRPIQDDYEPQNPLLNDQQIAAVQHALSSTDGIILITGKAGTGKTTLMKEVQSAILENGKEIFAFAPSSAASRGVQRDEGFENADTVAKLLQETEMHPALKHQVIWVDEAGMLSNKDMNSILQIAETQSARVILSGDTRQHTSVERGDALRIIENDSGLKPVTVDKIQRQRDNLYKDAVFQLSEGKIEQGFKKLDRLGTIHEINDNANRLDAVAEDYINSVRFGGREKEVLVVAPTHAEGDLVTERIRHKLKEETTIGETDRMFTVLKNRQLTQAEKMLPENYYPGDVVIYHQNAKGIKAGKKFDVLGASDEGIAGLDKSGENFYFQFSDAGKFSVYEPQQLAITEGDRLRITANGKCDDGKNLFNGSTFTVQAFDKAGNIELSNGSTISADFGHFNLGYVSTSHAAQGKTADKVIISQSSSTFKASSMEQFYVSVSRGREAVSIYTDDKENLLDAVSQSGSRTSATELVLKQQEQLQEINRIAKYDSLYKIANNFNTLTISNENNGLQTETRKEQDALGR